MPYLSYKSYESFDLSIEQYGDKYRSRARSSQGEDRVDFELPFTDKELRSITWLDGALFRHVRLRPDGQEPVQELSPKQFGTRLFDTVFAGEVGRLYSSTLTALHAQNNLPPIGLRIRLRLNDAPELAVWPWEYLYNNNDFLALSEETLIVRYLEMAKPPQPLEIEPPLQILVVVSAPKDVQTLQVDTEWRRVKKALAALEAQQLVKVERLRRATVPALQARLERGEVHLLHFIGHGYFNPQTNEGALLFEDKDRNHQDATADLLGPLLRDHRALRLLFLNACEGATSGRNDLFAGMAQRLVQQGTPAVVAMQFPVGDKAATAMAQEFYRALASEYPVDAALAAARKAIFAANEPKQWGTPVLFSRSPDNRLIVQPQGDLRRAIPIQPFEPETIKIPGGDFLMGSTPDPVVSPFEMPQHTVTLATYRIGKYPVTNRQYLTFVQETKHAVAPEAGWQLADVGQTPVPGTEESPIAGVTWDEAVAYCEWLSNKTNRKYRLPAEAEWEKAARGQDGRRYPWGNSFEATRCNSQEGKRMSTSRVGAYSPKGDSVDGCADMAGNVWEWTSTRWGNEGNKPQYRYPYNSADGREDMTKTKPYREYRVCRGGSFDEAAACVTCTVRGHAAANETGREYGFRVVMELPR